MYYFFTLNFFTRTRMLYYAWFVGIIRYVILHMLNFNINNFVFGWCYSFSGIVVIFKTVPFYSAVTPIIHFLNAEKNSRKKRYDTIINKRNDNEYCFIIIGIIWLSLLWIFLIMIMYNKTVSVIKNVIRTNILNSLVQ